MPANRGTATLDESAHTLFISGAIDNGTTAQAHALLQQAHSPVQRVVLNSSGGMKREGGYLADLIRRYRLSAHAETECSGVCAIALLASEHRTATPNAQICLMGFTSDASSAEGDGPIRTLYETAHLPDDLLAHLAGLPSDRGWCAPAEFLIERRVLHQISIVPAKS